MFSDTDIMGYGIDYIAADGEIILSAPGFYHIEWSLNLAEGNSPTIIGLLEDGQTTSGIANSSTSGNVSSGAIIAVDATPVTIRLTNFIGTITLGTVGINEDVSVSMRIVRFADGPSVAP